MSYVVSKVIIAAKVIVHAIMQKYYTAIPQKNGS